MLRYVRASKQDEPKVKDFLTSHFAQDYLVQEVSRHLETARGGLYLAWEEERIVAVAYLSFPHKGQAHLGGMRVLPERQEPSLYREFSAYIIQQAQDLDAGVVRCLAAADDSGAQAVLTEQLGFHVVHDWRVGTINEVMPSEQIPDDAGPAWAVDRDRIARYWEERSRRWLAGGPDPWHPVALTVEDLVARFEQGGLAVAPQSSDPVAALALYHIQQHDTLMVQYWASGSRYGRELAEYLRAEAHAWGISKWRYSLPGDAADGLLATLGLAEEREWSGVVLEKPLQGG